MILFSQYVWYCLFLCRRIYANEQLNTDLQEIKQKLTSSYGNYSLQQLSTTPARVLSSSQTLKDCTDVSEHNSHVLELCGPFSLYWSLSSLWNTTQKGVTIPTFDVGATRGVKVSVSAFLACHQCYCAGSSLAWGLNLRAVVCGIFWSSSPGVFSGYSGFLPSFIGLMVQPIK